MIFLFLIMMYTDNCRTMRYTDFNCSSNCNSMRYPWELFLGVRLRKLNYKGKVKICNNSLGGHKTVSHLLKNCYPCSVDVISLNVSLGRFIIKL